jgi:two-component system, sensor histidine kinase and response regulator
MSLKHRVWLLPAIAILASILSLSANYWFSAAASVVLTEADAVQYPAIQALNSMIASVNGLEELLKYAVSVNDKNAIAAVNNEVTDFNAAAAGLSALPRQKTLAQRLVIEFGDYHRSATDAASLMLGIKQGDVNLSIAEMQSSQAKLKASLNAARSAYIASFEGSLSGARGGLNRQLLTSLAFAIAIVSVIGIVSYFLIPAIKRDAVLIGVAEYTDSAVMTTDAEGCITWLNAGFRRMTGLDGKTALGRTPEQLLHREIVDPEACSRIRDARSEGKGWSEDVRSVAADGREYFAHVESQAVRETDGSTKGYIIIETDVTERRRDADSLRSARDVADAASRAKSAFLANMSHEIRTPLNGVIGMTGLLLDTPLNAEQREFAEIARSSGENLLSLINDVLDLSKIEAGHLEFESVDFDLLTLIESAVDSIVHRAVEKQIEVLVDIDPGMPRFVRGDPARVKQIVLNLLSNAVKFTERGDVRVTARAVIGSSRPTVSIEVRDSGIGITPAQAARLFKPFTQADGSMTRRFGGTGLGLSITKRLVDAMGGNISLESQLGEGSSFQVQIPLETAVQSQVMRTATIAGKHILVVEDHPINRRILAAHLHSAGARVTLTNCAMDAIQVWKALQQSDDVPHLILLDHDLPDHDGPWVADHMRSTPGLKMPPIVLLTSLGGSVRSSAVGCGWARVLTKPIKRAALIEVMAGVLGAATAAVEHPPAIENLKPALTALRVLVAEDNIVNQKLIVRLLEKLGASVTLASTGLEALELLQSAEVDLVLMDCQMPELDGYQATARIRNGDAGEAAKHLPVIALTASALSGDRERCLRAGMTDFLTKPIDSPALRATLEKYLPGGTTHAAGTADLAV